MAFNLLHQILFGMTPQAPLVTKVWERHADVEKLGGFSSSTIKKDQLEKFAGDFSTIYNKAWAGHGGLKQIEQKQVLLMFKKMKPVMDERIIHFVYHNDEPVAMFINLPDLNQWFKHLNGKFGLFQKLKFLWLKRFIPNEKFTGLVFGVVPEWQGC